MTVFCVLIYNREGDLLFSSWHQNTEKKIGEHERRLFFGMIFQMKYLSNALTPKKQGELEHPTVLGFSTLEYRVHLVETLTGYRIVMMTDPVTPDQTPFLWNLYSQWNSLVLRNPLHSPHAPGSHTMAFATRAEDMIRSLPFFK